MTFGTTFSDERWYVVRRTPPASWPVSAVPLLWEGWVPAARTRAALDCLLIAFFPTVRRTSLSLDILHRTSTSTPWPQMPANADIYLLHPAQIVMGSPTYLLHDAELPRDVQQALAASMLARRYVLLPQHGDHRQQRLPAVPVSSQERYVVALDPGLGADTTAYCSIVFSDEEDEEETPDYPEWEGTKPLPKPPPKGRHINLRRR